MRASTMVNRTTTWRCGARASGCWRTSVLPRQVDLSIDQRGVLPRSGDIARTQVTGSEVARLQLAKQRRLPAAASHHIGATRVEVATGGRIHRTGHVGLARRCAGNSGGRRHRHRGKQGFRVGLLGVGEDGALVSQFDNASAPSGQAASDLSAGEPLARATLGAREAGVIDRGSRPTARLFRPKLDEGIAAALSG